MANNKDTDLIRLVTKRAVLVMLARDRLRKMQRRLWL